jgi:photosystem II stability/assembly factor-like uncharacterized protein
MTLSVKKIVLILLAATSTLNASAQWVQLLPSNSEYEFWDMHFLNADTGFVVGAEDYGYNGLIFRTTNGGDSWDTTLMLGTNMMSVHFINDTIGFMGTQDGGIYKTSNMGGWWSYYTYCLFGADITNLYVYDIDSAFNTNNNGTLQKLKGPNMLCQVTAYSGFHGFFPGTGAIRFLNSQFGYVAGGDGAFAITNDGGATWVYRNTDPSLNIFAAWMTSETHGIVAGRGGKISMTFDGGVNWSTPFSISNYHIFDIQMLDSLRGYAVGGIDGHPHYNTNLTPLKGMIWKTYDGGYTWMVEDSSATNMFSALQIIHDSLAFAVGYNGQIFRNQTHMFADFSVDETQWPTISAIPSPTFGNLQIHLQHTNGPVQLVLSDVTGRTVHQEFVPTGTTELYWEIHHVPSGLYFLQLKTHGGILVTKKILKQ